MSNNRIESLTQLDEFLENNDNSRNIEYISAIPEICKNEPCLLGVDEAGRGPVLGPMVYGIAFCPLSKVDDLKSLECADSKSLTEEKRDSIFSKLCAATDFMGWAVEVISPNIISNNMEERSKINLNKISMDSAIKLIKLAQKSGANISEVYVDTVGKPEKYEAYLTSLFPGLKIKVSKKADALFPIVSAASICAKVSRDHSLQVWKFSEDMELAQKEFGSGYPGDPVTKKFLVDYADPVFGYPRLVRFSWSSTSTALVDKACTVDWSDVEEDDNTAHTPVISSFFKNNASTKKFSHPFFIDRNLSSCDTL